MASTTSKGLFLWDLGTDLYNHTQLVANLNLIDSYLAGMDTTSKLPRRLHTVSTVPGSGTLGDVVYLTTANGGYPGNILIKYDGSAWRPTGGIEVQPTVPASGNFNGRVIILSAADSGFAAWSVLRYNGSTWDFASPWANINNGAGATNIKGLQQAFDTYVSDSARGLVQIDRTTGTKYRVFIDNATVGIEVVT